MSDWLLRRLPRSRAARWFLVVAFTDAVGRGLFLAGSALFYTQVIGLSTTQVGTGLSIAALCGLICGVPIGRVADRIGAPNMMILLQVWRAAGFLVYPFLTSFPQFLVVACFLGIADSAVPPILQSIAGSITEDDSPVGTMATVAVVRNAAYSLSALGATVAITLVGSSAYVGFVLANAVAFLLTAVLLMRLRLPRTVNRAEPSVGVSQLPWRDLPFLGLALLNGILYLHVVILSVILPLWIVTRTPAPKSIVGVVLFVNTIIAVTLQVRLSRGGDDLRHAGRLQRRAGVALAVFCGLAAASALVRPAFAAALVLLAAVALTLGEIWQSAGGWGVSFKLSPPGQRNFYLGLYNLGSSGMAVLGPSLLSFAVIEGGPIGWAVLGAVFLLVGVVTAAVTRHAHATRAIQEEAAAVG
jgi:MFS family permease